MKKQLRTAGYSLALMLCLTFSALAFAQPETGRGESDDPCDKEAQTALIRAVRQQEVDPQKLESCRADLREPPAGPHDVPVMAAAALVLAGHQNARDLLPYLKGRKGWSLADEHLSSIYGPHHLVSALALRDRTGKANTDRAVRDHLRAKWTLFTLSAASSTPRLAVYYQGEWQHRDLSLGDYQGLFVHAAGPRSSVDRARWIERTAFHGLLSAALDWPWKPREKLPRARPQGRDWPLALAVELAGDRPQGSDAALWGLAQTERAELRSYVNQPTAAGAGRLIRWLKPFAAPQGVTVTWIRYQRGIATVMSSASGPDGQTEGPWVVAAGTPDRAWRIEARRARVEENHIRAWDRRPEDGIVLRTQEFGPELFRVVWDRRGWRVESPP